MVSEANKPEAKEEEKEEKSASAARREMRQQRKKAILEHKKEEPKDNQDDPRDVEALKIAQETIGDYKLKVSPDYHVPEDQHTDAGKKKLQMCLLEDSLVKMRQGFNERFLGLRDLKKALIYAIRRSNNRIREIDFELAIMRLKKTCGSQLSTRLSTLTTKMWFYRKSWKSTWN